MVLGGWVQWYDGMVGYGGMAGYGGMVRYGGGPPLVADVHGWPWSNVVFNHIPCDCSPKNA